MLEPVPDRERRRAITTIVAAFADDPVERWLFPDRDDYVAHFPDLVAALGGRAFDHGTAWGLADLAAVALWLPPGTGPDAEAIGRSLGETVAVHKHDDLFSVLEQMDERHPTSAHWYYCPGSPSTPTTRAVASAPTSWPGVCRSSTSKPSPPTWRPRIPGRSRSTAATGSSSSARRRRANARRSR